MYFRKKGNRKISGMGIVIQGIIMRKGVLLCSKIGAAAFVFT